MQLRALVGPHVGQVRDYSPVAARGALASGMAERVHVDVRPNHEERTADRPAPDKPKVTQSRRKG